jgi:hypothetical protein
MAAFLDGRLRVRLRESRGRLADGSVAGIVSSEVEVSGLPPRAPAWAGPAEGGCPIPEPSLAGDSWLELAKADGSGSVASLTGKPDPWTPDQSVWQGSCNSCVRSGVPGENLLASKC